VGFAGPRFFSAAGDDARLAVQALGILQGTFPVNYLGVEYTGATPAFPLAVWFALAGPSPFALDLFAYGVGLAILGTGYGVARRLLPPPAALLALVVLAVPPLALAKWSLAGSLDYPLLLLTGNVMLLLTHTLFFRGAGRARTILGLGLVSGATAWAHSLSIVYLAPALVLGVRTGLAFRRRALLFVAGALVGALPALLYEAQHFPTTRLTIYDVGALGPPLSLGERARLAFGALLPGLLGARPFRLEPSGTSLLGAVVLLLGALAVLRALARDREDLAWLAGLGATRGGGAAILWIVALSNVALVVFTQRGVHGGQYVLPLYSVLPCWLGDAFYSLWGRRRALGIVALGAYVWLQCLASWATIARASPENRRWRSLERTIEPLRAWLDARGIDRVYWGALPFPAFQFSYLTGTRVVAAHLWSEKVSSHGHRVDAAVTPPFVLSGGAAESLADGLRALGMEPRVTTVGSFAVVEPAPVVPMSFAPISPEGWTVTASHRPEEAGALVDRDATTGWSTRTPQLPGQWLAVDLGSTQEVARIDLLALDWTEVPAGFRVETSRDGQAWTTVASAPRYWGPLFFSERHAFFKVQRGRVQAIFRPVPARLVRVVLTGDSPHHEWAAREVFVYRPGPPGREVAGPEILAAIRREQVSFVHANPWLSAVVRTESRWTIGATEWNDFVNSYGRAGPPGGFAVFRAGAGDAILAGSDADRRGIREMLTARWATVRESDVGPYRLFVLPAPDASRRRLPRAGWTASATENDAESRLGIDGHARTRWVSRSPAGPELTFTADLGTVHRVRGVEVRPGQVDVGLEGSRDGAEWARIAPVHWAGPLFWTGWELLRAGQRRWTVSFSPVDLRYLRLRPLRANGSPWAIEELRVLE
jgi:hypothetical protein